MRSTHPIRGHDHFVAEVALVRDSEAEHLVRDSRVHRELAEADDDERREADDGEDEDDAGLAGSKFSALRSPENKEADEKT